MDQHLSYRFSSQIWFWITPKLHILKVNLIGHIQFTFTFTFTTVDLNQGCLVLLVEIHLES